MKGWGRAAIRLLSNAVLLEHAGYRISLLSYGVPLLEF